MNIKFKKILFTSLAVAHLMSCKARKSSSNIETVGGVQASEVTPPYILKSAVAITNQKNSSRCSGVLIDDDVVLTAKHCLRPDLIVNFGIDLATAAKVAVAKSIPNDKLDVAILILSQPAPTGFAKVPLANTKFEATQTSTLTVAGYGLWFAKNKNTFKQQENSSVLQIVENIPADLDRDDLKTVEQFFGHYRANIKRAIEGCQNGTQICLVAAGQGTFEGDSGAPYYDPKSQNLSAIHSSGINFQARDELILKHRKIEAGRFIVFSSGFAIFPLRDWITTSIANYRATRSN